jgi:hypothetical protein
MQFDPGKYQSASVSVTYEAISFQISKIPVQSAFPADFPTRQRFPIYFYPDSVSHYAVYAAISGFSHHP